MMFTSGPPAVPATWSQREPRGDLAHLLKFTTFEWLTLSTADFLAVFCCGVSVDRFLVRWVRLGKIGRWAEVVGQGPIQRVEELEEVILMGTPRRLMESLAARRMWAL
jgi:hypothetical protein